MKSNRNKNVFKDAGSIGMAPYQILAFGFLMAGASQGQNAIFEFTGNSTGPNQFNSVSAQPAGGIFSAFTRTGLTWNNTEDQFNSTGYTISPTLDPANYVSFSITPDAGNVSILQSLSFSARRSNFGPATGEMRLFGDTSAAAIASQQTTYGSTNQIGTTFNFKDVISGETLTFRGYGYSAGSTSGTFRYDNVATTGASPGFTANTAAIALAADTNVYANSSSLTLSGPITGAFGLEKIGTNTVTLTGTNSYSGPTSVTAGTLAVGNAGVGSITSAVTVASGATLAGTGTISGAVTVNSGGTYAVGNSGIGTQTLGSSLALNTAMFAWQLNAPNNIRCNHQPRLLRSSGSFGRTERLKFRFPNSARRRGFVLGSVLDSGQVLEQHHHIQHWISRERFLKLLRSWRSV